MGPRMMFGCLGIRCSEGMPRAVEIQKEMPITSVVAGSCTVPMSTKVASYHAKITVYYGGSRFLGR